jgi:hypothetical protein
MAKEGLNPALLDAPPGAPPPATLVAAPRRGARKRSGPQVKRLHWTPVRGPVERTWWGGPPGDLIAAARRLIPDDARFARLFVADPTAGKKKGGDRSGVISLVDARRAQNCAIALAKLRTPVPAVAACLRARAPQFGGHLLAAVDIANLTFLTPTPEEARLVAGFAGDASRLGPAERFFAALGDVPAARGVAAGLRLQCEWEERVADVRVRLGVLVGACAQVSSAARLARVCKAALALGNRLNLGDGAKGGALAEAARPKLVRAFTLPSLLQLHLTRSWDGTTTGAPTRPFFAFFRAAKRAPRI